MPNWDDVYKKFDELYEDSSKTYGSDKEYLIAYSHLLLKITANFISLIRSMCRNHENKEIGTGLENWFETNIDLFVSDLTTAIYDTKFLNTNPSYLRFILARLATYPMFIAVILGDKNNPDSVDTNLIVSDLIRRVKNNFPTV